MKKEIEQALYPLCGLPLISISRSVNMEEFHFGERHVKIPRFGDHTPVEVGEYALHVQCAWRIVDGERIIVASRDVYEPAGDVAEEPADFDWMKHGANRCDERVSVFWAEHADAPLFVTAVEGDVYGGFRLLFSEGYELQVFPNDSCPDEHWRFFKPDTDEDHFVVTGKGIES